MHFHFLIDDCSGPPFLTKLCSTVCHIEQIKILEPACPGWRTWVLSGHVQWQTEGLGKDVEKRVACVNVSCCCHMLGIPVGWQLSWFLDGWKHAVFLLYDCAFEAMFLLASHLRCIPVGFKHFSHSLTCSFHWIGTVEWLTKQFLAGSHVNKAALNANRPKNHRGRRQNILNKMQIFQINVNNLCFVFETPRFIKGSYLKKASELYSLDET